MVLKKFRGIIIIILISLVVISPFLFSWSAIYTKGEYRYTIHLSPIYYAISEKNEYGFNNYTQVDYIWNLKPEDLYANNTNFQLYLSLLSLMGLSYFITTIMFSILLTDGLLNGYKKEIDFSMGIIMISGIIYYIYLYIFLSNIGYSLCGNTFDWSYGLSYGSLTFILAGVIYTVSNEAYGY